VSDVVPEPTETDHVVALWRLQSAYADVVTRRAWDELGRLFLPAAEVHLDLINNPSLTVTGPGDLGRFIGTSIERFDHFTFVVLNTVVELDTDAVDDPGLATAASGRIFMCEIRHETSIDAWHNVYGIYQDTYRRVDGRWWIADRRYRSISRQGPDAAVFGVPPGLGPLGR
jgi:hypothetical protein